MGHVCKFIGSGDDYCWADVSEQSYESAGVSVRWLIGAAEGAPHFAVRYFEIEPGASSSLDIHEHDHGVFVLRGRGEVLLGEEVAEISFGDAVYVWPEEVHQFRCVGDEPLGFLCVIPARSGATE
jgi:quercetin dioxygenase-like cupin family protein